MNNCYQFSKCRQENGSPARAKRRVRAGGPPPAEGPSVSPGFNPIPQPDSEKRAHSSPSGKTTCADLRTLISYSAALVVLVALVFVVSLLAGLLAVIRP